MKHYQSCIAASFVFLSFVVSCPFSVNAVEIGIDDQAGIYDYLDAGQQGIFNIDFELNEDQDGNRSKRLQIYALQQLAFSEQSGVYENMDFSVAPDTMSVSGGGGAGFYRTEQNGEVKAVTISTFTRQGNSGVFVSAPDFSFSVNAPSNYYTRVYQDSDTPTYLRWGCMSYYTTGESSPRDLVATGIGEGFTMSSSVNYNLVYFGMYKEQIPTISAVRPAYASFSSPAIIGGLGESVVLPTGIVDIDEPWNYYNNVLLPYMQDEFPGFDEFFVFPEGYVPPAQPTTVPVEYPTLPGFDWTFAEDGTLPAGAESVNYQVPDLDTKTVAVPQFDWNSINPAEVIAPVSNGLTCIWALISDILSSFSLYSLVSLSLLVGIITALLLLGR